MTNPHDFDPPLNLYHGPHSARCRVCGLRAKIVRASRACETLLILYRVGEGLTDQRPECRERRGA